MIDEIFTQAARVHGDGGATISASAASFSTPCQARGPDELITAADIFDHCALSIPQASGRRLVAAVTGAADAACGTIRDGAAEMRGTSLSQAAVGILLCVLAVAPIVPAAAQSPGDDRRVALVVGNFGYAHVPRLANPGNDAALIATTLRQLGFTLVGGAAQENVDKTHFDKLVQDFGRTIQGADVALFYYAGHGMQVDGSNWLVPTDANPTRPQDLEFQMVNADLVLKQMDGAGTRLNLVILDACRNNPFTGLGTRAVQGGLAQMHAPEGTMISFATQPGNVAADGTGADGPYAMALAAAMRKPGLDIFHVFNQVGLTVKHETNGAQQPWESSSPIDGEFYFTQTEAAADTNAATAIDAAPATPAEQPGNARSASSTETAAPTGNAPSTNATSPTDKVASAKVVTPPANSGPADHGSAPAPGTLQGLAEQGKADAQFDLGFAYAKGQGVPQDDALARHWFAARRRAGRGEGAILDGIHGGARARRRAELRRCAAMVPARGGPGVFARRGRHGPILRARSGRRA